MGVLRLATMTGRAIGGRFAAGLGPCRMLTDIPINVRVTSHPPDRPVVGAGFALRLVLGREHSVCDYGGPTGWQPNQGRAGPASQDSRGAVSLL